MKRFLAIFLALSASLVAVEPVRLNTCVAIRLHPSAEIPGVARIFGDSRKFWPQRSTLAVRFMGGTRSQRDKAWTRFKKIDSLVNLTFVRVSEGAAHIRVSFDPSGGHWSYIGTDCRSIVAPSPTMNLALFGGIFGDSSAEWDRVTLHEVGHGIGILHEHQHPQNTIKWNVPKVIAYYKQTQGWSEAEIRYQVLNKEPMTPYFRGTVFDKDSLWEYPVEEFLTLDGFSVGWNKRLSPLDVTFLQTIYP